MMMLLKIHTSMWHVDKKGKKCLHVNIFMFDLVLVTFLPLVSWHGSQGMWQIKTLSPDRDRWQKSCESVILTLPLHSTNSIYLHTHKSKIWIVCFAICVFNKLILKSLTSKSFEWIKQSLFCLRVYSLQLTRIHS